MRFVFCTQFKHESKSSFFLHGCPRIRILKLIQKGTLKKEFNLILMLLCFYKPFPELFSLGILCKLNLNLHLISLINYKTTWVTPDKWQMNGLWGVSCVTRRAYLRLIKVGQKDVYVMDTPLHYAQTNDPFLCKFLIFSSLYKIDH